MAFAIPSRRRWQLAMACLLAGAALGARAAEANAERFPCRQLKEGGWAVLAHNGIQGEVRYRDGRVEPGDGELLKRAINACKRNGPVRLVDFSSPGGSVDEGIKMALNIREAGLDTQISPGSYCTSACTFAFLGGLNRSISATASYNVHAFSRFMADPQSCETIGANSLSASGRQAIFYLVTLNTALGVGLSEDAITRAFTEYGKRTQCDPNSKMPRKFDLAIPMYLPVATIFRRELIRFEMESARSMLGLVSGNAFGNRLRHTAGASPAQRYERCTQLSTEIYGPDSQFMQERMAARDNVGALFPRFEAHVINMEILDALAARFPEVKARLDAVIRKSGQQQALQQWRSLPLARQTQTRPPAIPEIDQLAAFIRDGIDDPRLPVPGLKTLEPENHAGAKQLFCLIEGLGDVRLPGNSGTPSYLDRMFSVSILTTKAVDRQELQAMDIITDAEGGSPR